jgi:hypothetical protein
MRPPQGVTDEMGERDDSAQGGKALGTIPLKQVRVSRSEMDDRAAANPMNRLVPYLDLFSRLSDVELARLAVVGPEIVAQLRKQVVQVERALHRYLDLLPRLGDDELVRLTGASNKTIRFWRLCRPRGAASGQGEGEAVARAVRSRAETAPHPAVPPPPDAPRGHISTQPTRPITVGRATPPIGHDDEPPTPALGMPAVTGRRVTPGLGSPPITVPRPTPAPGSTSNTGAHPAIEITGSPFPGYDYDPDEPIPDELSVDLPDPSD